MYSVNPSIISKYGAVGEIIILRENYVLGENVPQATWSTTVPTRPDLG
jgi:hypothetical protein